MSAQTLFIVLPLLVMAGGLMYPPVPPAAESRVKGGLAAEWMERGTEAYRRGHFEEAVAYLDKAAQGYEQERAQSAQCQALAKKAEADLALGRSDQAIAALSLALQLTETIKAPSEQASMLGRLGTAYFQAGRIEEALRQIQASVDSARALKNHSVTAASLNNLGNLLASQGHYEEALKHYLESAKLAEQANDYTMAAKALTNAARASVSQSNKHPPESLLVSAHEHIKRADDSHDKAFVLISLGQLYQRLETSDPLPIQRAYDALTSALSIAEALGDRGALSYALGYLGALYEKQWRFDEALRLTRRAQFIAQAINRAELLYRWQWQIGRILGQRGEVAGAIAAYQRAVAILQPIRQELLTTYRASDLSFRDTVGAVYLELADLLLRRHLVSSDLNQNIQDLIEARQTVELMKAAEIEDYFQDDCVAALQAKTKGVDQLAPKTAALYPIILADRMELLLSLPSGIKLTTVPIRKPEITERVRRFREMLEKRTTREYLPQAQALYDLLIRPLEQVLASEGIDTLVFIPDDPLRTIPLAALYDGQDFLIRHYAVAITPGLTLTDPRPIEKAKVRVLLNGLTESSQGFPPLPFVQEELERVAGLYESRILKDQDFRVANLQGELAQVPFSVVHIASHGQFKGKVRDTFLLAYDGKIYMDTLEQVMGLSRYRDEPVELLTLSACQTAAGDDRAALGLAGVAIKAGARSALASLWFINDRASALLVSEFYRRLQDPTLSKAKALQQAQWVLLNDKRYRHPGYWAPFLLIGNWL